MRYGRCRAGRVRRAGLPCLEELTSCVRFLQSSATPAASINKTCGAPVVFRGSEGITAWDPSIRSKARDRLTSRPPAWKAGRRRLDLGGIWPARAVRDAEDHVRSPPAAGDEPDALRWQAPDLRRVRDDRRNVSRTTRTYPHR